MADGGITHLDLQPLAPLTAENEMAETLPSVIQKLKSDAGYRKLFKAAFGGDTITTQRLGKALSQFMLMLVSANSKYDRVMRGEAQFILPEQLGYEIFQQKCISCHPAPFLLISVTEMPDCQSMKPYRTRAGCGSQAIKRIHFYSGCPVCAISH